MLKLPLFQFTVNASGPPVGVAFNPGDEEGKPVVAANKSTSSLPLSTNGETCLDREATPPGTQAPGQGVHSRLVFPWYCTWLTDAPDSKMRQNENVLRKAEQAGERKESSAPPLDGHQKAGHLSPSLLHLWSSMKGKGSRGWRSLGKKEMTHRKCGLFYCGHPPDGELPYEARHHRYD